MLYPINNQFRQRIDLSGFWDFRFDPDQIGEGHGWPNGLTESRPIAVPASWNDQFEDGRDYLGWAWYQTTFQVPWGWEGKRIWLRFDSVNYLAEVWLNGVSVGQHIGGHLPFSFEVTTQLKESNLLVVKVDGSLAADRVPPGNIGTNSLDTFTNPNFPAGSFDFFPFCGIHRRVWLYATPQTAIEDITVITTLDESATMGTVQVQTTGGERCRYRLTGHGAEIVADGQAQATLSVPNAALWSPAAPNLYDLTVELLDGEQVVDQYSLQIGIRTIAVDGNRLLLNGQPLYLRGFGRHEDFPIVGRGVMPALIIKDYSLMRWLGANSFRTTHYPYSDEMMDLADRLGFLVIDETPAVGLFFAEEGLAGRLATATQQVRELITRDKNHPSVIMWSLANEPHTHRPAEREFLAALHQQAKALDQSRLITVVSKGLTVESFYEYSDVVCVNRYAGWYTEPGQIEAGAAVLSTFLDQIYERYQKPMILTEFGTDTIPGWHAQPPEMFSEEYQVAFLEQYFEVLKSKPYIVGQHIWNLCDFKTSQAVHRMGAMNYKGLFTRDRRPKMAAHRVRALWNEASKDTPIP